MSNQPIRSQRAVRTRSLLKFLGTILLLGAIPLAEAARGNNFGFSRSAESSVDYTATPYSSNADCAGLSSLASGGAAISAKLVDANGAVPAHCRVSGTIPAEIGFEINLPLEWNGRLFMFGNGGFAGEAVESGPEVESREAGLSKGFATVRTDTGHLAAREPLATFARTQLNKVEDHGYRAVHETITLAKKVAAAFYSRAADYSYWQGCSTGGRQGMMAASRFPEDFDGIAAAAPTLRWSDVMMKGLSNQLALDSVPTLTQEKLGNVFNAVLARCDAKDGVVDGLLADPRSCDFDAKRDLPKCSGLVDASCFTEAETDALGKIRNGPVIKGKSYFPQYPGMEEASTATRWIINADGAPNALSLYSESYMKNLFFLPEQDASYNWKKFDFVRDPDRAATINELWNPKPTLDAFKARKGKILTYWGLADAALNPVMGMEYYDEIVRQMGLTQAQSFYQMYFVPGVSHCSGGYGPDQIDAMTPLIEWVESGKSPGRLTAQKKVGGTLKYNRSICSYPQATVYQGGDPEQPPNYSCILPEGVKR